MFSAYILQLKDGRFYIGSTANLQDRLIRHNRGECTFTKRSLPVKLVYCEAFPTRSLAIKRERQIKSWKSHSYVQDLIAQYDPIV